MIEANKVIATTEHGPFLIPDRHCQPALATAMKMHARVLQPKWPQTLKQTAGRSEL